MKSVLKSKKKKKRKEQGSIRVTCCGVGQEEAPKEDVGNSGRRCGATNHDDRGIEFGRIDKASTGEEVSEI
jgi:hypothetical protein